MTVAKFIELDSPAMPRANERGGKESDVKSVMKKTLLGVSLIVLMFTGLAGCVVYDPDPYPRYYYRERSYSYRPYYYSRPYYYRYYGHSHGDYRD
jgi:hypothetical protein